LTTFVLQELVFGSHLYLNDKGLTTRFREGGNAIVPVWTDGPFVPGQNYQFHLWGQVLSMNLQDSDAHFLAANRAEGIRFLTEHQGPVRRIHLTANQGWVLEIEVDGSAGLRHWNLQADRDLRAPAGTFRFVELLTALNAAASADTAAGGSAVVYFFRQGQSGGVQGLPVGDDRLVSSLFQRAFDAGGERNTNIARRFIAEWPQ
jgi:hypothetical protein